MVVKNNILTVLLFVFVVFVVPIVLCPLKVQAAIDPIIETADAPPPDVPTSDYLVGAFYFPGWNLNEREAGNWLTLDSFPERKPLLGYYNEGDPRVTDWEIKWALEHGINFFIFDWYRCSTTFPVDKDYCEEYLGNPIQADTLYLGHALHGGFFNSEYQDKIKFVVMPVSGLPWIPLYSSNEDLRDNLMPFLISNYFIKPNYLKIDGKPVLFLYSLKNFVEMSGSIDGAKRAINIIRQSVVDSGFPGVILLAEDRSFSVRDLGPANEIKDFGLDYLFVYDTPTYYLDGQRKYIPYSEEEAIRSQKQSYDYLLANSPIDFVGTASPFWDSYPQNYNDNPHLKFYISPDGYKTVINNLKDTMSQIDSTKLGSKMIILDAWNEYVEGHYIAPDAQSQFGYLQSARDTLTNKDNTPDYRLPEDLGMGPYDSLYQDYYANYVVDYLDAKDMEFYFDGIDNFIDILHKDIVVEDAEQLSFGVWIKSTSNKQNQVLLDKSSSFAIILNDNGAGHCVVGTQNNAVYSEGTVAHWPVGGVTNDKWHHVFCVYDGQNMISYLDGVRKETPSQSISGTVVNYGTRIRFGRKGSSNTNFYKGNMRLPTLEDRAFTDQEVLENYNLGLKEDLIGDINGDGVVNIQDYVLLSNAFGTNGEAADLDDNGIVNIQDYIILSNNFGKTF